MRSGTLPLPPGGLDLTATLESGQTFLWERVDGGTYGDVAWAERAPAPADDAPTAAPETGWYATTASGGALHARVRDGRLEWRASDGVADPEAVLGRRLCLDDDLGAVADAAPADPVVDAAFAATPGLRLVAEPFWPTLVSFICSAQMRVERIFAMCGALRERYGEPVTLAGHTTHTFPSSADLAAAEEADLRGLKLGYRAPYVRDTAAIVADGEQSRDAADGLPYEAAREALTAFVGVGEKVADCVLLFSLCYREAVPLDTWIRRAIATYFPNCERGSYAETSRAIRDRLGGELAGYVQTYVFHYLRTRGIDAAPVPAPAEE
ncbi:MAG: DNA-3-methyladenine glycosylase 2 [Halobacteriaceae archaeon]